MYCIDYKDLLCDLRHISSPAVTEFTVLISEHFNDRIVSGVKQSPFWATMVDETTDISILRLLLLFSTLTQKDARQQHV